MGRWYLSTFAADWYQNHGHFFLKTMFFMQFFCLMMLYFARICCVYKSLKPYQPAVCPTTFDLYIFLFIHLILHGNCPFQWVMRMSIPSQSYRYSNKVYTLSLLGCISNCHMGVQISKIKKDYQKRLSGETSRQKDYQKRLLLLITPPWQGHLSSPLQHVNWIRKRQFDSSQALAALVLYYVA